MRSHRATFSNSSALAVSVVFAALMVLPKPGFAQTVPSSSAVPSGAVHLSSSPGHAPNINAFLGAETFYNHPNRYTGTRSVVAVVDAGHLWNTHETLRHSTVRFDYLHQTASNSVPINPAQGDVDLGEFDFHATAVAHAAAGRIGLSDGTGGTNRSQGIAYGAQLWSGAVATRWTSSLGFYATANSILYPYATAALVGVDIPNSDGGTVRRTADVINSSWGYGGDSGGASLLTQAYDGIARQSGKTFVYSAGNSGTANSITGPGNGYNSLVVGALGLGTAGATYSGVADFSSRGAQTYSGPDGTVASARARIDIVAPGQNITLADYLGATGGYGNPPQNSYVDTSSGDPARYATYSGTSFAAPIVSGGAALLYDVGYDRFGGGDAIHANVIKAVLLNSADKITGWTNNTSTVNGVLTTTQALDHTSGAGALNLNAAFTQYTAGTTDVFGDAPGTLGATGLSTVGWDFGSVLSGMSNDYYFASLLQEGTTFTATLNWFVGRTFTAATYDGGILASDDFFVNLELEFWSVAGESPDRLIALSSAQYVNTEHLHFAVPETGNYMLRVRWAGERYNRTGVTSQQYGLAWSGTAAAIQFAGSAASAPEPGTVFLLLTGIGLGVLVRRRK
ncbi:MAG: hypothetical protein OHK0029_05990 [Armatimonadaceae bacterium]